MKVIRGTAGTAINRGQFVYEAPGGQWFPAVGLVGEGGVARKAYGEWPPIAIQPGEEFDIVTDGRLIAIVGTKNMAIELRGGRFAFSEHNPTAQGEIRLALAQAGTPLA